MRKAVLCLAAALLMGALATFAAFQIIPLFFTGVRGTATWGCAIGWGMLCGFCVFQDCGRKVSRMEPHPLLLWLLAAFFTGVTLLGLSFHQSGSAQWLSENKGLCLSMVPGLALPFPSVARSLLRGIKPAAPRPRMDRPVVSLCFAAALLVCWLPWILCVFPGTMSFDANSQILMIYGKAPLTNSNPIAQTGLLALMVRLGEGLFHSADGGVALYCGLQTLLMAYLLGVLLKRMAAAGCGRGLWIAAFAFYALCPAMPTFAMCVGKDTNFGMAVLFFSMELWQWLRGDTLSPKQRKMGGLRLLLAAVLCALLRNAGLGLVLISALGCLLVRLRNKALPLMPPLMAAAGATAVMLVLQLGVLPALGAGPTPESESLSLPLQACVRCAVNGELTPEEETALRGVMDLDTAIAVYNGELSDRVKDTWQEDASAEEKAAFWKAYLSMVLRHPATCFSAAFHNTYGYFMPGYMSTLKAVLFVGDFHSRSEPTQELFPYTVNPHALNVHEKMKDWQSDPLYCVLHSPGIYSLLTLLAAVACLRKGRRRMLICVLPALLVLLGCVFSAVNGYLRYALPLLLCVPFLLGTISLDNSPGKW